MGKALTIKRTKKFASYTITEQNLDTLLNKITEEGVTVIAIVPKGDGYFLIVGFSVLTEEIEVDVPDELDELLSDNQSDGVKLP